MKTEYLLECYERTGMDDFYFIVSLKKQKCFFVGNLKKSEKEELKKEIFNIFLFNELQHIEDLKRNIHKMKRIKDVYGCLSCFLRQKTKINIKRKLGETIEDEIIYELKYEMCGYFEREMLKSVLIDAGFEEFSYICLLNKKLFRVDKEEKTILPIVGISFQSKVILPQEVLINYSSR